MNRTKQLSAALNNFYEKPVAKVSLELFFTIGLVLFLAFFAIQPTLVTMSDLIKEIDDKKSLDDKLSRKLVALRSAQTEYAAVQDQLYLLDQAIPDQPDIVNNLTLIEKLASDAEVVITAIAVIELPENTQADLAASKLQRKVIPVRINVTGDYVAIRTFIESLLKNRRVFITEQVTFNVSEKSAARSLQTSINLNIPYYGVVQNATKQDE